MILHKTLPIFAVLFLAVAPDEGQWLPSQIRKMDWAKLKKRGMQLTKDQFWHPEKGGVLTASVQLRGCSASFVSADGLLVTNHHCAFGAINALSTPQQNYLRDGFVARDRAAELRARGVIVQIVRRIEDVTDKVHEAIAKATTPIQRFRAEQMAIARLVAEGEKEPDTKCNVASMFEGREYHLYYRTKLTDVRLVYAPPQSVGEFGGETDNWEWPRHTGDFCFLRAYAAPDGSPRRYHEENVPYKPQHILKVSQAGVQEGDLVLILGYPGRTERYLSSEAVKDRQGISYPMRLELYTGIIEILTARAQASEEKQLEYASVIKGLANGQKNALGMVKGLARNAVVERKLREEDQFRKWLQLDSKRQKKWGKVLDDVIALDLEARKTQAKDQVLGLLLSPRRNPFLRRVVDMCGWAERQVPEVAPRVPRTLAGTRRLTNDLKEVQVPTIALPVEAALDLPKDQRIQGMEVFAADGKIQQQVLDLIQDSGLMTVAGRRQWLQKGANALVENESPLVLLARGLHKELIALIQRSRERAGRRLVVGPKWIEAQQQWRGTSFYPDANSTMRVSIASVKGYQPNDGVWHRPHTTVAGVLDKYTGKAPFDCPKPLLAAARNRKTSRFFDNRIGDVPVCFLSDGDTTGGNSGSPVINGKGELVGLNFDRVFEGVSGDFGWNPDRSRNISVDIRYVLWILEQVQPAPHLLKEMGL
jgi:hypothetical protein